MAGVVNMPARAQRRHAHSIPFDRTAHNVKLLPPLSTSDNGSYVNQAGRDRTGLTLIPVNGRFLLVWQGSEAMKTCPHKHAHALHFGLLLTVSFLLAVVLSGGTRW
jgi:hypothetical protein